MDSLLCNEEWLMISPGGGSEPPHKLPSNDESFDRSNSSFNTTCEPNFIMSMSVSVEDWEEAFRRFVEKEVSYMPEPAGSDSSLIEENVRFKGIHWLIRSQRRLNLSLQTLFSAANYFDRFMSLNHHSSQSWKDWMFELLGVACLSVASKYNETIIPSFHHIQMEDVECSFESNKVQRMELTLLKALKWRLGPVTSYSYMELLTQQSIDLSEEFITTLTNLLLYSLLDCRFVEFRPCVITMSALEYMISKDMLFPLSNDNNNAFLNSVMSALIPKELKDDLRKCYKMMEECNLGRGSVGRIYRCPSSPVTVLPTHKQHYEYLSENFQIDHLSGLLKARNNKVVDLGLWSGRKRKRPEEHDDDDDDDECRL